MENTEDRRCFFQTGRECAKLTLCRDRHPFLSRKIERGGKAVDAKENKSRIDSPGESSQGKEREEDWRKKSCKELRGVVSSKIKALSN